jgi:hypothetical protein
MGERGVFPHVGRQTLVNIPGARQPVYPIVTGTFGSMDFVSSVVGEFGDKAAQSELQELQGTIEQSESDQNNSSIMKALLAQLPSGMLGGDQDGKVNELQSSSQAAQMQQMQITPRQPEEVTRQMQAVSKQVYPILEWHDEIMKSIMATIEEIPVLPALIDQVTDQINIFVFTLLAPFVLPIINQVKTELSTGSSEVIQSSLKEQHIVFSDDRCSDPTHSMLSKDHFTNHLNEPAGRVACSIIRWVVPQLMACWDDERIDANRTINRIVNGVFHHPTMRDYGDDGAVDCRRIMYSTVQQWWSGKDDSERAYLRDALSREGVEQGRNHNPDEQDSGHGCCKPLGMPNARTASSSGAVGGSPAAGAVLGGLTSVLAGGSSSSGQQGQQSGGYSQQSGNYGQQSGGYAQQSSAYGQSSAGGGSNLGKMAGAAVGGGALGGIVGGLLGGAFDDDEKKQYSSSGYAQDGSYNQNYIETGRQKLQQYGQEDQYGQAQYSRTTYPSGGSREEFQRYGQEGSSGYGYRQEVETQPTYGGGYEQTTQTNYGGPGEYESEVTTEGMGASGQYYSETA